MQDLKREKIIPNKYVPKQLGSQCTYNVIWRDFRAKTVAADKQ